MHACSRRAVISRAGSIGNEIHVTDPVHVSRNSYGCSAEEIGNRTGFPSAQHILNETVLVLQGWQVVHVGGVEDVPTIKISVAAAGTRIVAIAYTIPGTNVCEGGIGNVVRPGIARLELRVTRDLGLESRL